MFSPSYGVICILLISKSAAIFATGCDECDNSVSRWPGVLVIHSSHSRPLSKAGGICPRGLLRPLLPAGRHQRSGASPTRPPGESGPRGVISSLAGSSGSTAGWAETLGRRQQDRDSRTERQQDGDSMTETAGRRDSRTETAGRRQQDGDTRTEAAGRRQQYGESRKETAERRRRRQHTAVGQTETADSSRRERRRRRQQKEESRTETAGRVH
jgi:hypothetical protein